jgi:hypothetical protein
MVASCQPTKIHQDARTVLHSAKAFLPNSSQLREKKKELFLPNNIWSTVVRLDEYTSETQERKMILLLPPSIIMWHTRYLNFKFDHDFNQQNMCAKNQSS